jgi:hypothetical protein
LLAGSPLLTGVTGRYFEDCQEAEPHQPGVRRGVASYALDRDAGTRLWQVPTQMLGSGIGSRRSGHDVFRVRGHDSADHWRGQRRQRALQQHTEKSDPARRKLIERYLSAWHRDHPGEDCPVSGFAADLRREPGQAARAHHRYVAGVRNLAAVMATGDDDGMAQLCTMVGALVLARATEGDPLSEELLDAARTALTESGGQSEP